MHQKSDCYQVIYTWEDGWEDIHYSRPRTDTKLAKDVLQLRRWARHGKFKSPYSIRSKAPFVIQKNRDIIE